VRQALTQRSRCAPNDESPRFLLEDLDGIANAQPITPRFGHEIVAEHQASHAHQRQDSDQLPIPVSCREINAFVAEHAFDVIPDGLSAQVALFYTERFLAAVAPPTR